jgi:molecular chaperone DnaK
LNVSAQDKSSGKSTQIKITAQSGLSEDEIKKAVNDAEAHAEEDKKKTETAQIRNNLDNMIYQTEKLIKDSGAQLPEADVKSAQDAVADAKKLMDNKGELDELKAAFDKIQGITHKLTAELYKKQGGGSGGTGGSSGGGEGGGGSAAGGEEKKSGEDDVIDADYKDVN